MGAALDDAELCLSGVGHEDCRMRRGPRGPAASARARARAHRTERSIAIRVTSSVRGRRDALVEHHRDVRPELQLDVGRGFRREQVQRAVEVRSELGALVARFDARSARLKIW